jgi:hypothetical protein
MYAAEGWSTTDGRFFAALCKLSMHPEGARGIIAIEVVRAVLTDGSGAFTETDLGRAVRRLLGARMMFHAEGRFRLSVVGSELGRRMGQSVDDRAAVALRLLAGLPPTEGRWVLPPGLYQSAVRTVDQVSTGEAARDTPGLSDRRSEGPVQSPPQPTVW